MDPIALPYLCCTRCGGTSGKKVWCTECMPAQPFHPACFVYHWDYEHASEDFDERREQ